MIHKVYTIKILESRTRTLEARVEYLEQELNSADQITREQNSSVKITRTDTPVVEISRLERLEQRFEIMEEILAQPDGNQVRYYEGRIQKLFFFWWRGGKYPRIPNILCPPPLRAPRG